MRHHILRRTAERDPDGRTFLARQSENDVGSETNRENSSDLAHPRLDPVGVGGCANADARHVLMVADPK